MRRRRFLLLFLLIAVPAFPQNRSAEQQTAFARARHLRHGINVSHWFSQNRRLTTRPHHTDTDNRPRKILPSWPGWALTIYG